MKTRKCIDCKTEYTGFGFKCDSCQAVTPDMRIKKEEADAILAKREAEIDARLGPPNRKLKGDVPYTLGSTYRDTADDDYKWGDFLPQPVKPTVGDGQENE